jgi:hypothetical protein
MVKTDEGQLDWRETAWPDTFQVSFNNYSITFSRLYTDGTLGYVGHILNFEGRTVDSFSDDDLKPEGLDRMAELYQKARRQALSADKALDEILSQLNDAR